jgi:hypothetical protein
MDARTVPADDHVSASTTPTVAPPGLAGEPAAPPGLADLVGSIAEPLDLPASSFEAAGQPCGIEATESGLYAWRCTTDPGNCVAAGTGGIFDVATAAAVHAATCHSSRLDTDFSVTDDPTANALDRIEVALELLAERVEAHAGRIDAYAAAVDDLAGVVAGEFDQVAHYQRVTRVAAPARRQGWPTFAWHFARTVAGMLAMIFMGGQVAPFVDVLSGWELLAAGIGLIAVAHLTLGGAAAAAEVAELKYRQARRRVHERARRSASVLDPWERQIVSAFAAAAGRNGTSRIQAL